MSALEYHQVKNFRGYMEVPQEVFDQITPFMQRDQDKMQRLLRDRSVTADKPKWVQDLPEGGDAPAIEWSGYIIIRGQE